MTAADYAELGAGVVVGLVTIKWLLAFFKWQSTMLVNRSMEPLEDTVKEFRRFVENHMAHQASDHASLIHGQEKQTELLEKLVRRGKD